MNIIRNFLLLHILFFSTSNGQILIISGAPCAGKTTFCKKLMSNPFFENAHLICSADLRTTFFLEQAKKLGLLNPNYHTTNPNTARSSIKEELEKIRLQNFSKYKIASENWRNILQGFEEKFKETIIQKNSKNNLVIVESIIQADSFNFMKPYLPEDTCTIFLHCSLQDVSDRLLLRNNDETEKRDFFLAFKTYTMVYMKTNSEDSRICLNYKEFINIFNKITELINLAPKTIFTDILKLLTNKFDIYESEKTIYLKPIIKADLEFYIKTSEDEDLAISKIKEFLIKHK